MRSVRERDKKFRETYQRMSERGLCDSVDGAEYNRVRSEWVEAGRPSGIRYFILARANAGPDGASFGVAVMRR
jgi:hypothetical protein